MSSPEWLRVKEVFAAVLDEPQGRRIARLDELAGSDPALRAEVESLLAADAAAGDFINFPVLAGLATTNGDDADAVDAPDPNLGRIIGAYHLDECIGRGGMGAVYLARRADREFTHEVAIKMIRRGMDSDLLVRRFRHERQILASLDHPHIARLFDGGTTPDGLPYFVMEYVAGVPIDRYADEHRLTTPDRLRLCLGVFDAVQHAHDRHIVHRDLKPSNVIVTADGQPKLLDFGIAKVLDPQVDGDSTLTTFARPMTPDYASPEQILGRPIGAATDVYALGLLLYELLTGHRAYLLTSRTPEAIARVVCELDPERPSTAISRIATTTLADGTTATSTPDSVSATRDGTPDLLRQRLTGSLDAIVMKALRKEPEQRYPTVAALAEDVRRYLDGQSIAASRGALRYRASRWVNRHRVPIGVAALVFVAVTAAVVATSRWGRRSTPAANAAPAPVIARPAIAVVGFDNVSGRPADQWLSTAIAEMLTTELAGGGQLRVLPADVVARARRDVGGDPARAPASDVVAQLRTLLAADNLVLGSFVAGEGSGARPLRLDVRVLRASGDIVAVSGVGTEAELFTVLADVGRQLRAKLGLTDSSPDATQAARAAFPRSLTATRLYAEGIAKLRLLDNVAARDLFNRAAADEPGNPVIGMALASAWTALGYDAKAEEAARRAFDGSAALNREDRLTVEGRLYEATRQWSKAIDVYRTLWGFFADNIEYGLRLVAAQTAAGKSADALATIAEMRRVPGADADPRVDIAESQAASALADYARELAALQRALQRASTTGARLLIARARLYEGRSYFNQGKPAEAERSLTTAQQLFIDAGDRAGAAAALNSLGTVLSDQQDITRGQRMYEQSLATSEEIGDKRGMSSALNNLGILLKDQRRFDEARRAHERALALRREVGDRSWTAISLNNIGVVLFEQDHFREAATYYREALAIAREIGDKRNQVRAGHNLAIIQRETGDLAGARAGYEESIATRVQMGDTRGQVFGRVELGMVLLQQGEIAAARQSEDEAVRLARETKLKPGEAQALYQLGEIALVAGDFTVSRRQHDAALARRREMKETRTILESELALATLALEEGHPADALREVERVKAALGQDAARLLPDAELLAARAELALKNVAGAARSLETVERVTKATERVSVRYGLDLARAELDGARGRRREARDRLVALRTAAARSGLVLIELECRLRLIALDRAEGRATAQADAKALEQDARAHGAELIARRAADR